MMSESNRPAEPREPDEPNLTAGAVDPTDDLEGSYTDVDGEGPKVRTVAGDYTRTDGVADDADDDIADDIADGIHDESVVGEYTSTDEHPETHHPVEPEGDYVSDERPKPHPHPGLHHI